MTKRILIEVNRDLELDINHLRDTGTPVTVKNLATYVASRLVPMNAEFLTFRTDVRSYSLDYDIPLQEPTEDAHLGLSDAAEGLEVYEVASRLDRDLQRYRDEQGFLGIRIVEVRTLERTYSWGNLIETFAPLSDLYASDASALLVVRTFLQFGSFAVIECKRDGVFEGTFDVLKVGEDGDYTLVKDDLGYDDAVQKAQELATRKEYDLVASQLEESTPKKPLSLEVGFKRNR